MLYKELKIGDKELKLRMRARDCVALEKKLGCNPLEKFMEAGEGKLPTMEFVINTLHASLQALESGYTLEKTYDLFDEYVEKGNTIMDIIPVLMGVFEISGFFKNPQAEK